MSFNPAEMRSVGIGGEGSGSGSGALWRYRTSDTLSYVKGPGYFDAFLGVLISGDRIHVTQLSNINKSNEAFVDHVELVVNVYGSTVTTLVSTTLPDPTPDPSPISPDTPTTVLATETSPGVVSITWAYPAIGPVDFFYILRDGSDLPNIVPANLRVWVDSTAPVGSHDYQVQGFNTGYGRGVASSVSTVTVTSPVIVTPPTSPTSVALTALSASSLRASWAYSANDHSGFSLVLEGPNGYFFDVSVGKAVRQYDFTGLQAATTYQLTASTVDKALPIPGLYAAAAVTQTTDAGTVSAPLTWATGTQFTLTGVAGTSLATTTSPLQTSGGVTGATKTFTILSGPSGLTLGSTTGVWTWASPTVVTNAIVSVVASDGVNTLPGTFTLTIAPTTLSVSRPSGVTAGSTITATGSVAFSKTWTASGGVAPYTVVFNGQLPSDITATTTSPSLVLAGTSTQAFSTTEGINVTITSADGQVFDEDYILQFNTAVVGNSPPVFSTTPTQNQVTTEGSATTLHTFAATDPNGDTITWKLESVVSQYGPMTVTYSAPTYTCAALGLTFNTSTRVMAITPVAGMYLGSDYTATVSADDSVDVPLQAASTIQATYTSGVSTAPTGVGIVLSGGSGVYGPYTKTGTAPSWLGTFSTSTGLFTGGSGTISDTTPSYTFTLSGVDDDAAEAEVTITITVLQASTNDFTSRVAGTIRAFDFEKVYINGIEDPTRIITSLGDNGNRGPSYKGTLWGEAAGSGNSASSIDWEDDPTGSQAKVLSMLVDPTDGSASGTYPLRIDGTLTNTSSFTGGTVYPRIYFQFRVYMPRAVFAFCDTTSAGEIKLGYLGTGFVEGETIIIVQKRTGFFSLSVDNAGNNSLRSVHTAHSSGLDPHHIPRPNPWHSSSTYQSGDIVQVSGQWAKAALAGRPAQTVQGTVPSGTSAADKDAYYRYYGYLSGSYKGLIEDTTGYGDTGTNSSGIITPWLDEREHIRNGEDKGWPDIDARTYCPYLHVDEDNTFQIFFERDPVTGYGYVMAWHSYANTPFQLIGSGPVNWGFSADALESHKIMELMIYDSDRGPNPNRPAAKVLFKEVISSLSPIKGPGGHLPPFNPG